MTDPCPYCGGISRPQYELDAGNVAASMFRCEDCDGCHAFPPISQEALSKYYETSYFSNSEFDKEKGALLAPDYYQKMAEVDALPQVESSVLEIGPGYGYFLKLLLSKGKITFSICEPSATCRQHILDTLKPEFCFTSLEDALNSGVQFEYIYCFHTVEHVSDPRFFLQQLGQLLAAGGKICILTPNGASAAFKLFGHYWDWSAITQHVSFLSSKIPESFYESCGLKVHTMTTVTPSYVHYPSRMASLADLITATIRRLGNKISVTKRTGNRVANKFANVTARLLSRGKLDNAQRKFEVEIFPGPDQGRDELLLILKKNTAQV